MGIIDKVASLGLRHETAPRTAALAAARGNDPLQQFLADPWSLDALHDAPWLPPVGVQETSDEVVVAAEVPGLDRDDVDLTITPRALTIRGEKRERREDTERGVYVSATRFDSFVHTVPLPPGLDTEHADAKVKHGVMTVRIPKVAPRSGTRRIPITT